MRPTVDVLEGRVALFLQDVAVDLGIVVGRSPQHVSVGEQPYTVRSTIDLCARQTMPYAARPTGSRPEGDLQLGDLGGMWISRQSSLIEGSGR